MSTYKHIWVPWESGYKEHLDRLNFSHDHISAIREQTNQFKNAISQQTSDQAKNLIASNEQIISALESSFGRLSQINERGFDQVTSAVESLHSDVCYLLGNIIQKLEFQNRLLGAILTTLQEPYETQIKEFYRKGCEFIEQGKFELAKDCFKESIDLKMGKFVFPSHYQLGRLYLESLGDPKEAEKWLFRAYELLDGKEKVDKSFAPVVADCKFFLSKSYYSQLRHGSYGLERGLINDAIKYAKESVELNPHLSQGYYHLAKYSSYALHKFDLNEEDQEDHSASLLRNFELAVTIDKDYLCSMIKGHPKYDGVFEPNRELISELIAEMTKRIEGKAGYKLAETKDRIARLKTINISKYNHLRAEFNEVFQQVQLAEKDFQTKTYFGFDDCLQILDN